MASTNSYKRLVPGYEAPSILTYSAQNRSAACRVPYGAGAPATRLEMRFPDSTSNPYLAFASLMMAGIDGIKNKTEPVGPMDEDLFELTLDEIREKKIPQMPATLREALEGLIADNDFLKPVFTAEMMILTNIINLKDKFGLMKLDQQLLSLNQHILVNQTLKCTKKVEYLLYLFLCL